MFVSKRQFASLELKFRVVLSDKSSKKLYESGITSIASETVCYPAKLVHGHIENLIKKRVKIYILSLYNKWEKRRFIC